MDLSSSVKLFRNSENRLNTFDDLNPNDPPVVTFDFRNECVETCPDGFYANDDTEYDH